MPKLIYASSSKNSDMFYAVRVPIPDPFFYIDTGEKKYVFLDHREYGVFKEHNKNLEIEVVLLNPLAEEAARLRQDFGAVCSGVTRLALLLLEKYGIAKETIEVPSSLPLDLADELRASGVNLVVKNPLFPERLIKKPQEIEALREALVRTQHAYTHIEEVLRNSTIEGDQIIYNNEPLTSETLKKEVEKILLSHDMTNDEGIIISCGEHAAIPHHRGKGLIRPHQTIVCDIFPRHRETGYFADMTRTYVKGKPSEDIQKMYNAVHEAQTRAIDAVKPGGCMGDIHKLCEDIFVSKGYHIGDKGFIHGTGHGLGIDIHEFPYVRKGSSTIFEPGHVVTIEPGLYYPEIGGVRIEDVVVVAEDGCRNLTDYHKNYIIE